VKFRERVPDGVISNKYRLANYQGPLSDLVKQGGSGLLVLDGQDDKWHLHGDGETRHTYGGLSRYPLQVELGEASECHVTLRDSKDPSVWGSFDLPDTSVADFEKDLADRNLFRTNLLAQQKAATPPADAPLAQTEASEPAFDADRAAKKKATEYAVANYDGSFTVVPEAGLSGTIEVKPDGNWHLHLGFRKHVTGDFANFPFQVESLSEQSCRVTVRNVDNPNYAVRFELPSTAASELLADLAERGYSLDRMMAGGAQRRQRRASGEWWAGITPYRILIGCHYSGARTKGEVGDLRADQDGIHYKALLRSKVSIPWRVIQDIQVTTQSTKRVTVGRAVALGVFALAAKKGETFTYIHISDANSIWSFAAKKPQAAVLSEMQPVLSAFNSRVTPTRTAQVSGRAPSSVADELSKLAKLKADGVLSEAEFAAQKAKLISPS
jgi:hypothetical protein